MRNQWRRPVPDFIGGWWESSRMKSVSLTTLARAIPAAAETRLSTRSERVLQQANLPGLPVAGTGQIIGKFERVSMGIEPWRIESFKD
jgi:hypothetical protein